MHLFLIRIGIFCFSFGGLAIESHSFTSILMFASLVVSKQSLLLIFLLFLLLLWLVELWHNWNENLLGLSRHPRVLPKRTREDR